MLSVRLENFKGLREIWFRKVRESIFKRVIFKIRSEEKVGVG